MLIHQLMDKMTRRHLNGQRSWRLMTGVHHPDCGWTLDHLDLGAKLEADSLALMHMKVDSVLTSSGGCWRSSLARDSGHCQPMTIGLTLASIDHKMVGGSSLVARVGWIVRTRGQSCLTLRPVTSHKARGSRGHCVLMTSIGLGVTQLVPGDDRGWVGAEAASGGHAVCLICASDVTLNRQRIGAWSSSRAGMASVAPVTGGRGWADGAGEWRLRGYCVLGPRHARGPFLRGQSE